MYKHVYSVRDLLLRASRIANRINVPQYRACRVFAAQVFKRNLAANPSYRFPFSLQFYHTRMLAIQGQYGLERGSVCHDVCPYALAAGYKRAETFI